MDEWIYQQPVWTDLAEEIGEECQAVLESILPIAQREPEICDASYLLAQLVLSDSASRYLSLNALQHDAHKKEARKKIRETVHRLLRGGDQEDYLQGLSRWLGQYDRLGGVPVDGFRDILAFASGKAAIESTGFVSDLVVQIERLSEIAYSEFVNTARNNKSMTAGTFRFRFSDRKNRPGISTKKPTRGNSAESSKP